MPCRAFVLNIHPLRPRDHEDAGRVAIAWLTERHRKGWRSAFEALLDHWRPEDPQDGWPLDEDAMTMVSISPGEWLIARGEIHARGGLQEINAIEQALHRHYARWADEAIPLLGSITPRQAITTPAGLERVKGLLREYEDGERQQSTAQGRPAVSYQFLWDALGISR